MMDYKKYTLLVVDDEETLRNAMIFDFKRKGFTVLSAENGIQAFGMIRAQKVDLVISDMRMPGGDGMSLLEQIRIHDSNMPALIFLTGFADVSEEEALEKGARKILVKPFDRKVLMNSVLEVLGLLTSGQVA